jgi:hypothetical protein
MFFVTPTSIRPSVDPVCQAARVVSYASSPEQTSASGCRPEPHRLSRQAPWVSSLDQRLVGDALTNHGGSEDVKPRQGVILDVAFVQPESELIDVAAVPRQHKLDRKA